MKKRDRTFSWLAVSASIGDYNIDFSEALKGRSDAGVDAGLLGDINNSNADIASEFFDFGLGGLKRAESSGDQEDLGSAGNKCFGRSETQTGSTTSD